MNRIAAIVVTYNSGAEIGACLDSLQALSTVVVVDNASSDRTVDEVSKRPWVRLISNRHNRGFAAAVNQGVRACSEPLLLILNPDTVLMTGLDGMASVAEEHGIVGGALLDAGGKPQAGFTVRRLPTATTLIFETLGWNRFWPENPVNRGYRYVGRNLDEGGPAEQPAGAFLMVRRDVFQALDGFDESFYPVWFEDVDFARRAKDAGYRVQYFSDAAVRHLGAHSVGKLPHSSRTLYWYVSLLRYAAKYFSPMQFRAICGAVVAGCGLKFVTGLFVDRGVLSAYGRVVRIAVSSGIAGRLRDDWFAGSQRTVLDEGAGVHVGSHPVER